MPCPGLGIWLVAELRADSRLLPSIPYTPLSTSCHQQMDLHSKSLKRLRGTSERDRPTEGHRAPPVVTGDKPAQVFQTSFELMLSTMHYARCLVFGGWGAGKISLLPSANHVGLEQMGRWK